MKTFIYRARASANGMGKRLAENVGGKCLSATLRPLPYREGQSLVVNYGNSRHPATWKLDRIRGPWLNAPEAISNSANKLRCLKLLTMFGVSSVRWTEDRDEAKRWIEAFGIRVFCRATTTGSRGKGITVIGRGDPVPNCPLYTMEFKKEREYRVHVFRAPDGKLKIIDTTQKKRRNGAKINPDVRNLRGGWVFCRKNIDPISLNAQKDCVKAVEACGLDFAGIDLLVDKAGNHVVCELNTAPSLIGTTMKNYVKAIKEWQEELHNEPIR